MAVTKKEMVKKIAEEMDITQASAKNLFDSFFHILEDILKEGESYTAYGFGTFYTEEQEARNGYNPATGKHMILPKRTKMMFRCSDVLKEAVNES